MIFFNKERHEYRLDDEVNGELCISGTTFLSLFKEPFRSDYWSWYTALRYALDMTKPQFSKMLNMQFRHKWDAIDDQTDEEGKYVITQYAAQCAISYEELVKCQVLALADWKKKSDDSKTKGTNFHDYKEGEIYSKGGLEYDGIYTRVAKQTDDLSTLHDPNNIIIAPELRMYNRQYKLSGTADKVFIYPDKRIDIDDWKTSETIYLTSKSKYRKTMMKGPLSHLEDVNHNHYCLQVSLYAYMLEQFGYKPNNLKFTHVVLDPKNEKVILEQTEYHTNFLRKEVIAMLEYYDKNKEELLKNYKKS